MGTKWGNDGQGAGDWKCADEGGWVRKRKEGSCEFRQKKSVGGLQGPKTKRTEPKWSRLGKNSTQKTEGDPWAAPGKKDRMKASSPDLWVKGTKECTM